MASKASENEKNKLGDTDLFRRSIGEVRPLPTSKHVAAGQTPAVAKPVARTPDKAAPSAAPDTPPLQAGDIITFRADGVQERVLKRLRQGHYKPESTLDLHGSTAAEAQAGLAEFIESAYLDGIRHLLVIHGKGYRSGGGEPVLKNVVNATLNHHPLILAYCSARPADGGTGALYVLLRQNRDIPSQAQNLAD